jgi:hypothetical protein
MNDNGLMDSRRNNIRTLQGKKMHKRTFVKLEVECVRS